MRLFQNGGLTPKYRPRLDDLARGQSSFAGRLNAFLADRYGASHLLKPVLDGNPEAFLTNGDDTSLQRAWAREHSLPIATDLEAILLAQIEEHRPDVFYNTDPLRYGSAFVRKLPSCVRKSIAWRAAPSPGADFGSYDLVVNNFPNIIKMWRAKGLRSEYFSPAHDPRMDGYGDRADRPIDVLFVGAYSRHHRRRAQILEKVAALSPRYNVAYRLDTGRLTKLADSPIGLIPPLAKHRRPRVIRRVASGPVFGLELYDLVSRSKIVLNGAIDMAGEYRGNMRCFEAMGCGALMVSDKGLYPRGFVDGENMLTYDSADEAVAILADTLANPARGFSTAARGRDMVRTVYSKEAQWVAFMRLVGDL